MNILYLSRTMGQGGAEKIVYQLAVDQKKRGNHAIVASCGGSYVSSLHKMHVGHYHVADLECKNPVVMLKTFYKLSRLVREKNIQVIHSHHRMAALYATFLKWRYPGVKLIYTAHNVFYTHKRLTAFSLTGHKIIAVGQTVRRNLIEIFGIDAGRIAVIPNGIDIEPVKEDSKLDILTEKKKEGYKLAAFIGRLTEQKGIDIFIKTMKLLLKKRQDVLGIVVGSGELEESVKQTIQEEHMDDQILMLGYQSHVEAVIDQIDVVMMPSRWEGFPLTPIEVFAGGKTLAASDIDSMREIVTDQYNGILVPPDDETAFADALELLLTDESFRQKLGQHGRATYESRFDYRLFVDRYDQVYRALDMENIN